MDLVATEPAPIAVEPVKEEPTVAPCPIAVLLVAEAEAPVPIASELVPVADED